MTTNYERRIEQLEDRMDRKEPRDSRTEAEVRAYIEEVFGQAIDLGPNRSSTGPALTPTKIREEEPEPTDPDAYNAEDYTDEAINSCPDKRRLAERVEWPEGADKAVP